MPDGDLAVVTVDSRIEHVTVYANGARVRRVATVQAPLPAVVRFVGLPVGVIDDTVRVELIGPAVVRSVRASLDAPVVEAATAEESAELRAARRRVAIAIAEVDRLATALERASQASLIEDDPTDEAPAPWSDVIAARRALLIAQATRELRNREALVGARREVELAHDSLAILEDRERRLGTTRPPKLHELRKHVELDLVHGDVAGSIEIRLEYQVAAARWAPSYVARLDGEAVRFEIRAVVAQDSGEDWRDVTLALSTAEPDRFAPLPELAAQRIGRKQDVQARSGFRAPPIGARALYADYERAFPVLAPVPKPAKPFMPGAEREDSTYVGRTPAAPSRPADMPMEQKAELAREVWDEESSRAKEAFHTPAAGSAPIPSMEKSKGKADKKRGAPAFFARNDESGGGESPAAAPQEPGAPTSTTRLDYGNLRMAPPSTYHRGSLVPAHELARGEPSHVNAIATQLGEVAGRLADLALPPGCVARWIHTYDYAFAADGKVDVQADGAWHSLALTAKLGTTKIHHVAVPREQPDVFRIAAIPNPFAGPLLPGPIDVYDRGQFLVTSAVDFTPPGATVDIGLGVDAAVKLARNTEFREEAAGMLRGQLRLVHTITIDVENLSTRPVDLEVRERIPVTREGDDDIVVTLGKVEPGWERWTADPDAPRDQRMRGGHRWRLVVAPGAKRSLQAGYEVRIPSKTELVGGNRRES